MKHTPFHRIFTILVIVILLIPLALTLILGPSGPGANEVQSSAPTLTNKDGSINLDFLSDTATWFSDHFAFRQELITLHAKLFGASSGDVLIGRDGWLFYRSTLNDYYSENGMTDRELHAAANNVILMQEYCDSLGAKFLFTVVPNKNTMYPDRMWDSAYKYRFHDYNWLYSLCADVNTLELRMPFLQQQEQLYFAHDSHWNSKGAALGADLMLSALGKESDYFSTDFSASVPHSGDLFEMLYPAAKDTETDPVYGGTLTYEFAKNSGTRPDSITIRTTGNGEGNLIMYRDSFGNLLYPYLADAFGTAMFSRSTVYDLSGVHSDDYVIVEIVERNLRYLISNVPTMPAPARQLTQLARLSSYDSTLEESKSSLDGCKLWQGTVECDTDSPVYLVAGDSYQAFLLQDGAFAAYLPENLEPTAVACYIGGELTVLQIQ